MKKLLLLSVLAIAGNQAAQAQATCNELFISEYVEGSGNNKALEIYNPTSNPINLSNYRIVRYSNGSSSGNDSTNLTGTIQPHDVWVFVNGQDAANSSSTSPQPDPALQAMADQLDHLYPAPTYMNGNDAIVLKKISPYAIIDVFGKIGEDPDTQIPGYTGFGWPDQNMVDWTKDHTLRRKPTVMAGDMNGMDAFNPSVQYDSIPEDTWDNLGMHNCNCPTGINDLSYGSKISVYPNPANVSGKFFVAADEVIAEIEVYNAIGQVVYAVKGNSIDKKIAVSTEKLRAGMYFVRTTLANDRTVVNKINIK